MRKAILSERAAVARINRALAKNNETLRRCRENSPDFHNLGRYYRLDYSTNAVVGHDVDLETLGRNLEVIEPFETVES